MIIFPDIKSESCCTSVRIEGSFMEYEAINTIVTVTGEQNHSNFNEVLSYFCRSSVEVHSRKPSNLLPM